mmetsp:Transcript_18295/g.29175  ORF Transcript_18295/g.29175 Transcript_18295/m.29175 type:complete len:135 (+) Transcript_18295:127-531(+)
MNGSNRQQQQQHPLEKNVRKGKVTINGVLTDLVLTAYSNKVFIIATQNGKCGTLVTAERDTKSLSAGATSKDVTYSTKTLIGKREDPYISLLARNLVAKIGLTGRSLLLGINIKDLDVASTKDLIKAIETLKVW